MTKRSDPRNGTGDRAAYFRARYLAKRAQREPRQLSDHPITVRTRKWWKKNAAVVKVARTLRVSMRQARREIHYASIR